MVFFEWLLARVCSKEKQKVTKALQRTIFKKNLGKSSEPVITRWGTWLSAALYFNDYSDQLTTFTDDELINDKTVTPKVTFNSM